MFLQNVACSLITEMIAFYLEIPQPMIDIQYSHSLRSQVLYLVLS
jgi:hypothetical protein